MSFYTASGDKIRNPTAYASTGAPMYKRKYGDCKNINEETDIYKLNLKYGKKYIGKTEDFERRMHQHFSGKGSQVTKKFKPVHGKIIDTVPGFFANEVEQEYTKAYVDKYGYNCVRGGKWTNSKTLNSSAHFKNYEEYDDEEYDDEEYDDEEYDES